MVKFGIFYFINMKTKLLKSTVSRVVNSAKNKAKSLKTLKPRITSVAKNTVKVNKSFGIFDVILNIFNNYNTFKTIFKFLSINYKLLAPSLLIAFMFFRKNFRRFAILNTIITIIAGFVIYYTDKKDTDPSIFLGFQLIVFIFNFVLDYCGLRFDNILNIFDKQLNNIADGMEHLDKINKSSDEDDNKSSNIINEMKKTHDNVKDSDIIKNSTPNYYVIAGIIIIRSIYCYIPQLGVYMPIYDAHSSNILKYHYLKYV